MANEVMTITFSSEAVEGNEIVFAVDQTTISQTSNYEWKNTPNTGATNPFEIQVTATVGTTGATSATSFETKFNATRNGSGDYQVVRTDNVVTITILTSGWEFNSVAIPTSDLGTIALSDSTSTSGLTLETQIAGQEATDQCTYCYLYEPLRVVVTEADLEASKLYVDIEIYDTADDSTALAYLSRYGDYDINPGNSISIDLMKLAQQHHDAGVFNFSNIDEIVNDDIGWQSIVSKYKYKFRIYSDITLAPIEVYKLPILGGRLFKDFNPLVTAFQPLTEAQVHQVNLNRWGVYPYITSTLVPASLQDSRPTIEKVISTSGKSPCGGYLVWKSRLGGWMTWGFDIKKETIKNKYEGRLDVGMFESTLEIGGNPFIPVDYTGIETSYTISLKELSLLNVELMAVVGINQSPAVYYMKDINGSLELMRVSSASAPLSNQAHGGDFSVSLKSISQSNYKTK